MDQIKSSRAQFLKATPEHSVYACRRESRIFASHARFGMWRLLLKILLSATVASSEPTDARVLEAMLAAEMTSFPKEGTVMRQEATYVDSQEKLLHNHWHLRNETLERAIAIAYITTGAWVAKVLLPLSIRNLRNVGFWYGDVFVLTDHPECVPAFLATPVRMPAAPVKKIPNPGRENATYAKYFKQKLLELLPLKPEHRFVFYMDTDIFIGKPIAPFFETALAESLSVASVAFFREGSGDNGQADHAKALNSMYAKATNGSSNYRQHLIALIESDPCSRSHSLYHGGVFFAQRNSGAAAFLKRWADWYDSPCHRDQPYLTRAAMMEYGQVTVLPQEKYYGQPTTKSAGHYWTFNHFTRTRVGDATQATNIFNAASRSIAGQQLLGLSPNVSASWWRLKSPFCELVPDDL
uniref:Nucleotide-diphospho-sugar transferase domain-containing protein n=1 Tax=Chrysotila carterae TaxID=13221 RepID=A0A7S4BEA1_CHRCT